MIHNYFRVIHITVEKIILGNTQLAHNILGTCPEDPIKILTSGAYRGPIQKLMRTNTEIDDFIKKLFFRSNSTYRKNKYSKVLNWDIHGMSTGPSCGTTLGPNDGTF